MGRTEDTARLPAAPAAVWAIAADPVRFGVDGLVDRLVAEFQDA